MSFRSPLRSPLFWRLLCLFCAVNLLVLLLGSVLTRSFIHYTRAQSVDWPELAEAASDAYLQDGAAGLEAWRREQRGDGIDATLYQHAQPLSELRLPGPVRRNLPEWLGQGRNIQLMPFSGYEVVVQQVLGNDGQMRQLVGTRRMQAWLPRRQREQIFLVVQLVLSLLLIGLAGWWVARGVARPVEALRAATRRMAEGEFSVRLGRRWIAKRDELGQLARDFNGMAERLEALVAHDRMVLQDMSHELRSPLARLQLILDLAQHSGDQVVAAGHFAHAEREIARLDRITGDMLALSRLESGLPGMQRQPAALRALLEGRLEALALQAEARQMQLQLLPGPSLSVLGSAELLERAIDNLLANALKYGPRGSTVELDLRRLPDAVELSIRDHGPGVPEEDLPELFRPFFRGGNAKLAEGHGLGLAIVQRVVQAHDGVVWASNAEGGGLRVRLRLPLPPSPAQER